MMVSFPERKRPGGQEGRWGKRKSPNQVTLQFSGRSRMGSIGFIWLSWACWAVSGGKSGLQRAWGICLIPKQKGCISLAGSRPRHQRG